MILSGRVLSLHCIMTYEQLASEWTDNSTVIKCHTSGSTGTPTDILLPKEQMKRNALRTIGFFSIDSESLLYSCISPEYIGGKMMLVRAMVSGAALGYETPSNRPLQDYSGPEITLLSIVPSQMIYILDNIDRMPKIKNILIGGSAIPSSLRKRIAASRLNVWESYGMTETSSHIAIRKVEATETPFHTLPGVSVSIKNGALEITIEGWKTFLTNDAAEITSPGQFRILGRLDNVIISGGKKIHPEEVERKLSELIKIPFYITSVPDEKWGQRVIMVAEGNEKENGSIIANAYNILPKHEIPKQIFFTRALQRTPNGKIIRVAPKFLHSDANVL